MFNVLVYFESRKYVFGVISPWVIPKPCPGVLRALKVAPLDQPQSSLNPNILLMDVIWRDTPPMMKITLIGMLTYYIMCGLRGANGRGKSEL